MLLWLPFSNHQPIRYIDELFTAVTCVCVTGLVTVVPAAQFTVAGKVILLILIQIGGLGIIACTTAFLILVGKRINMKEQRHCQDDLALKTQPCDRSSDRTFSLGLYCHLYILRQIDPDRITKSTENDKHCCRNCDHRCIDISRKA